MTKAKKAVDGLRKSVGAESFVDMLPYLKADPKNKKKVTLEGINTAFAGELNKILNIKINLIDLIFVVVIIYIKNTINEYVIDLC